MVRLHEQKLGVLRAIQILGQEIEGDTLESLEGALWTLDCLDRGIDARDDLLSEVDRLLLLQLEERQRKMFPRLWRSAGPCERGWRCGGMIIRAPLIKASWDALINPLIRNRKNKRIGRAPLWFLHSFDSGSKGPWRSRPDSLYGKPER